MNSTMHTVAPTVWDTPTLENRFAKRVAARLSQGCGDLPHDITERLRASRERALERARWATQSQVRIAAAVSSTSSGRTAVLRGTGWGWRLASLLPVVAMVAGLVLVEIQQDADQTLAAADIDAALLSDDLPPDAYSDAGFAEFLRASER